MMQLMSGSLLMSGSVDLPFHSPTSYLEFAYISDSI